MAKTVRKSIYGKEIKEVNISDILGNVLEDCFDPDWYVEMRSDWVQMIEKKLQDLDFWNYNFISGSATYWCGVLTLEPFHTLSERIGEEEEILNTIKNEHLKIVETEKDGVILRFYNPTKSPLYRFFNQHKEDGCGGNVTYSVNVLLSKLKKFLEDELSHNLSSYGQWMPYEEEEELA